MPSPFFRPRLDRRQCLSFGGLAVLGGLGALARRPFGGAEEPELDPRWVELARLLEGLDELEGAAVDPADGNLRLIGRFTGRLPAASIDDLYVALAHIRAGVEDFGVSIEPDAAASAGADELAPMKVRLIPDTIQGSGLALQVYLADLKLKALSLGLDPHTGGRVTCPVQGFQTLPERLHDKEGGGSGYFGRLWFKPAEDASDLLAEGYAVRFGPARMNVLSESPHPCMAEFATHMTEHFAEFPYPEIAVLPRLYRIISLARWFFDAGFPVDALLETYRPGQVATPATTPTVFAPYREETISEPPYIRTQRWGLAGGVDFPAWNTYFARGTPAGPGPVARVRMAAPPRWGSFAGPVPMPDFYRRVCAARPTPDARAWEVELDGARHRVVLVPTATLA